MDTLLFRYASIAWIENQTLIEALQQPQATPMFEYNLPKSKILLPNFERLRVKAIKSLPGEALNSELTRIEQLENCFIQLEKMSFTTPRTKIYFNP